MLFRCLCRLSHGSQSRGKFVMASWRMSCANYIVPRSSAPQNLNLILTRPSPLVPNHGIRHVLGIGSLTAFSYMTSRSGKSTENALSTTSTPGRESMSSMAMPDGMSGIGSMSASSAPVPIMHSSCGTCSFVRQRKSWSTSIPITPSTMLALSLQTAIPLA